MNGWFIYYYNDEHWAHKNKIATNASTQNDSQQQIDAYLLHPKIETFKVGRVNGRLPFDESHRFVRFDARIDLIFITFLDKTHSTKLIISSIHKSIDCHRVNGYFGDRFRMCPIPLYAVIWCHKYQSTVICSIMCVCVDWIT